MYQQQVQFITKLLMLLDALSVIVGVYSASYLTALYHNGVWGLDELGESYFALFLIFLLNYLLGSFKLYSDRRPARFWSTAQSIVLAVIIAFALLSAVLIVLRMADISRMFLSLAAGIIIVQLLCLRGLLVAYVDRQQKSGFSCHQILLVGSPDRVRTLLQALAIQNSWGHKVIGYLRESDADTDPVPDLPCLGHITDLQQILTSRSVDETIFAISPHSRDIDLAHYIRICDEIGTVFRIVPALFNPKEVQEIRAESLQGIPTLVKSTLRVNPTGSLYKGILDIVGGLVGGAIFLILYPIIGLLIKLDSPGPILFSQQRVGQHGRIFNIFKFRTMVSDADQRLAEVMAQNEMQGHMFKAKCDPRVTKIGRFLRKTSLDEFPQFINVLRGEMSLVGTRPPTVQEVARYENRHRRRLAIKPGITGLWQVSGRNKINNFEQVVALDLQYIDNWRFLDDLRILWKTIWVVLARKAY